MADAKKLIIDRSKWLRGESQGRLLRGSDGKMCCLGFYGLSCGLMPDQIRNEGLPSEASPDRWPEWLLDRVDEVLFDDQPRFNDSEACDRLTTANDNPRITEAEREAKIAAEFAKHGVGVEFIDGPVSP